MRVVEQIRPQLLQRVLTALFRSAPNHHYLSCRSGLAQQLGLLRIPELVQQTASVLQPGYLRQLPQWQALR
jgi:hypothetical protein